MMQDNETELLVKVLKKQTSPEEALRFSEWLNHSEKNQRHFASLEAIWQQAKDPAADFQPGKEQAWEKVTQNLDWNSSSKTRFLKPAFSTFLKIAASISLLLLSIWTFKAYYSNDAMAAISYESGKIEKKISLPDHSIVHLQPHSSLRVLKNFSDPLRAVELEGEAFFDIAKDKKHPFTIATKEANIEVVGTSFNVKAVPLSGATEVVVHTGIVSVEKRSQGKDKVTLSPGFSVLVSNQPLIVKNVNEVEKSSHLPTGSFHFKNTELSSIVKELNKHFKTSIQVENKSILLCTYTGSFENASLDEIIDVLTATMNLHYQRKGADYVLQGNACP